MRWIPVALGVALNLGCSSVPPAGEPLPDRLPGEVLAKTPESEVVVQVGHFLNDDRATTHYWSSLRDDGVLGVYLRVRNQGASRILIDARRCQLFANQGGEWVPIRAVPLREVGEPRYEEPGWDYYLNRPLTILFAPLSLGRQVVANEERIERKHLENGVINEQLIATHWGSRSLAPGGVAKGVLFFDWDQAEPFRDDLRLAIDMRDLVSEWHTVLPVKLRVEYQEGVVSDDYR